MKTIFRKGMKVYDQVNFPDKEGKVEEIYISDEEEYPIVSFGERERVCYSPDGSLSDRITKTLSTKPYKVEFQGFEQKASARTYEEAVEWCIKNLKDYRESVCTEYVNEKQENAIEALRRLVVLRDYYNEGWKPNWQDDEWKYIIENYRGKIDSEQTCGNGRVLAFKTKEIRDKFLEEQRELLETAKPLL